jgi:uncharacterized protein
VLKPTTLLLPPGQPAQGLRVEYPKGQAKVLGSLGQDRVSLYESKIEIPVRLTLSPDAKPGKQRLVLKLKYQACDDKVCLAPKSLEIPLDVTIESRRSPVRSNP